MGNNLNTPGVIKFWWKNELVQTQYSTIHQIPIMTLQKTQSYITNNSKNQNIVIIHYNDSQKSNEVQQKLKKIPGLQIYSIPSQNSKQNFDIIRNNNPSSLGKMILNGERSHPLFKYLKKNTMQFFNYNTMSAQKNIKQPIGMFLVENSNDKDNCLVTYYNQQKIGKFIQKKTASAQK